MIDSANIISDAQLLATFNSGPVKADGVPRTAMVESLRHVADFVIAAVEENAGRASTEAIRELTASLRGFAGPGAAEELQVGASAWARVYWSFVDTSSDAAVEQFIDELSQQVRRSLSRQIIDQRPGRLVTIPLTNGSLP